jgi:hypothetical protein
MVSEILKEIEVLKSRLNQLENRKNDGCNGGNNAPND